MSVACVKLPGEESLMFKAWKVGRLAGIDIHIHWTFFILLAWVFLANRAAEAAMMLPLVVAAFGCVVLHELGHALAARQFGIGTRDITLLPIGGVARLERMSEKPWEEFWIAVAGPAVNIVIAFGLFGLIVLGTLIGSWEFVRAPIGSFLTGLLALNVFMVVFNMIPAFPMDGGRVLRAVLASFMGMLPATQVAVRVASVFAVLFAVFGVIGTLFGFASPMIILVAAFVWFAGQQELAHVHQREYARRTPVFEDNYEPLYESYRPAPVYPRKPVDVWVLDSETGRWVKQEAHVCN